MISGFPAVLSGSPAETFDLLRPGKDLLGPWAYLQDEAVQTWRCSGQSSQRHAAHGDAAAQVQGLEHGQRAGATRGQDEDAVIGQVDAACPSTAQSGCC